MKKRNTKKRNFTNKDKEEIWNKYFDRKTKQKDVFGRPVSFSNAEFDHICPYDKGGKTVVENGIPLAPLSNEEKSDNTQGKVNNKSFKVTHSKGIGILKVNNIKVSK